MREELTSHLKTNLHKTVGPARHLKTDGDKGVHPSEEKEKAMLPQFQIQAGANKGEHAHVLVTGTKPTSPPVKCVDPTGCLFHVCAAAPLSRFHPELSEKQDLRVQIKNGASMFQWNRN
jgi:hypothetical protein